MNYCREYVLDYLNQQKDRDPVDVEVEPPFIIGLRALLSQNLRKTVKKG